MMSDRDTQFAGFADLLWKDLSKLSSKPFQGFDGYVKAYKQTIAQRAYDLVLHATKGESLRDMTEWPEEGKHAIH